jgi:hypothetical protein
MKKILAILLLSLWFTTQSQADDIKDFQIEGMSIGDSALDFYSEKEILQKKSKTFNNKLFYVSNLESLSKKYDYFQVIYDPKKFIIYGLEGIKNFTYIDDCLSKQKEIITELNDMFSSFKKGDLRKDGNTTFIRYRSRKNDSIIVACNDTKKNIDLRVLLRTKAFENSFK